jgi:hypothetical protein
MIIILINPILFNKYLAMFGRQRADKQVIIRALIWFRIRKGWRIELKHIYSEELHLNIITSS